MYSLTLFFRRPICRTSASADEQPAFFAVHSFIPGIIVALCFFLCGGAHGEEPTVIEVRPDRPKQEFQGLGCGAIFYEGHITSLATRGNRERQEQLYDAMFRDVRTDFLHVMIRHDHEPQDNHDDPYAPAFDERDFKYCEHTLAICEAAKKRNPKMQFFATLYTPPGWMKTNGEPGGGGQARATLKPEMELKLGEFCWAFLAHMHRHGQTIQYLSICNEPDWPHTQPGYFLTPAQHAALFEKVALYLDEMARRFPDVPRARLVAPDVLSAVGAAEKYLPPVLKTSGRWLDVIGAHDYDPRGHRWKTLRDMSGGRPVWMTEGCVNRADHSPGLLNSATSYWFGMTECFNDGVNVWMAYDWVYPPREGGEALIHMDWGKDYRLTKIYHAFRQWAAPLVPGMRVVETTLAGPRATGISVPGVKASAFVSADKSRLVVHVVAAQDAPAEVVLKTGGRFLGATARRHRTSAQENFADLPDLPAQDGQIADTLPARGMVTYEFTARP